jgi:CheY-like chemotaxis protein
LKTTKTEPVSQVSTTTNYKILYVDDDPDDQSILEESLAGFSSKASLVCASDGEEAISYLNSLDVQSLPALIVLDLNLPKWSGHQTLSYLKSTPSFAGIPVVIFSTSGNKNDKEICTRLGAASYLEKPYHFSGYNEVVKNFISLMKDC